MHNTYPSIRNPVTFIHNYIFLLPACIGISPSDFVGTNEFQARLFLNFFVLYTKQGERSKQFLLLQEEKTVQAELWTNRRRLEHLYHKEVTSRLRCIVRADAIRGKEAVKSLTAFERILVQRCKLDQTISSWNSA
jgi:hypothetical protein